MMQCRPTELGALLTLVLVLILQAAHSRRVAPYHFPVPATYFELLDNTPASSRQVYKRWYPYYTKSYRAWEWEPVQTTPRKDDKSSRYTAYRRRPSTSNVYSYYSTPYRYPKSHRTKSYSPKVTYSQNSVLDKEPVYEYPQTDYEVYQPRCPFDCVANTCCSGATCVRVFTRMLCVRIWS